MNSGFRTLLSFAAMALMLLVAPAWAQQPKPKPQPDPPAAEKKPADEATPEDPAVAAILATKPTTPAECIRAAKILADLGRADLAKALLKKVLDAKLDREQLADLGEQLGSPVFFDLSGRAALRPEGKRLADAVMAALNARLQDSKRIAALIGQLQDPSPDKRLQAVIGLRDAGGAAVGPLVSVLADPARAAEYANVRAALVEMGPLARGPLVAVVQQADPQLTVQAIEILGAMNDPKVAFCLLRPCLAEKGDPTVRLVAQRELERLTGRLPDRPQAAYLLTDAAKAYFDRHQPVEGVVNGKVELWRWDPSKRRCVARGVAPDEAARSLAARLARDAYAIAPDNQEVRLLYLTTLLEQAAYENGLDRPWDENSAAAAEAKQLGAKTLDAALRLCDGRRAPRGCRCGRTVAGRNRSSRRTAVPRGRTIAAGPGPAIARSPAALGGGGGDRAFAALASLRRFELCAADVGLLRGQQWSAPRPGCLSGPDGGPRVGRNAFRGRLSS